MALQIWKMFMVELEADAIENRDCNLTDWTTLDLIARTPTTQRVYATWSNAYEYWRVRRDECCAFAGCPFFGRVDSLNRLKAQGQAPGVVRDWSWHDNPAMAQYLTTAWQLVVIIGMFLWGERRAVSAIFYILREICSSRSGLLSSRATM